MLREVLAVKLGRMRVVPFGLIRINLGQEAMALAINSGPTAYSPSRLWWPMRFANNFAVLCRSSTADGSGRHSA